MIIYPGHVLLHGSSHLWGTGGQPYIPRHGVAPDGVCRAPFVAVGSVSSYLTFPPLLRYTLSGLFLLHFPWSRLHRVLPGTLALWSPDFPRARPFGAAPATIRLTHQHL